MEKHPVGVLATGTQGKQSAQSWAPTPGRMGPRLSAAAELCNIISWEEEMIRQWKELCSLLQASGDCWRQLGAAKAEFIPAVLQKAPSPPVCWDSDTALHGGHSVERHLGPRARLGRMTARSGYPARLSACNGHPKGKVLFAALPQPPQFRMRTFVCFSFTPNDVPCRGADSMEGQVALSGLC